MAVGSKLSIDFSFSTYLAFTTGCNVSIYEGFTAAVLFFAFLDKDIVKLNKVDCESMKHRV